MTRNHLTRLSFGIGVSKGRTNLKDWDYFQYIQDHQIHHILITIIIEVDVVTQESLKRKSKKLVRIRRTNAPLSIRAVLVWLGPLFLKGLALSFLNLATFDLETLAYSKGNILTLGTSRIAQKTQ